MDAFGSHFWMALFEGQKRWTFFNSDDLASLRPCYKGSLDPTFDIDLAVAERTLNPYSVVLKSGQVLFVPAGSPHRVENLTDSVAVSGNFINKTNLETAVKHLKYNSIMDPRAADLLREFVDLKLVI